MRRQDHDAEKRDDCDVGLHGCVAWVVWDFFGLRRVGDLIREIEEYHRWVTGHALNPDNRVNGNQSELELIPRLDLENIGRGMQPSGKR